MTGWTRGTSERCLVYDAEGRGFWAQRTSYRHSDGRIATFDIDHLLAGTGIEAEQLAKFEEALPA